MTDERLVAYWITLAQRRYNENQHMIFQTRGEYIEDYITAREVELDVVRKGLEWQRLERFKLRQNGRKNKNRRNNR